MKENFGCQIILYQNSRIIMITSYLLGIIIAYSLLVSKYSAQNLRNRKKYFRCGALLRPQYDIKLKRNVSD